MKHCIAQHCAVEPADVRLAPIPTGKFNTSFFVTANNQELVLRVAPPDDSVFVFYERNMMLQEPAVHELVQAQTTAPVASIIAYDDSRSIVDRPFLLMERLPGNPLCDTPGIDAESVYRQVGSCLAQVHQIQADNLRVSRRSSPDEAPG